MSVLKTLRLAREIAREWRTGPHSEDVIRPGEPSEVVIYGADRLALLLDELAAEIGAAEADDDVPPLETHAVVGYVGEAPVYGEI